jgi:hypothetical protein
VLPAVRSARCLAISGAQESVACCRPIGAESLALRRASPVAGRSAPNLWRSGNGRLPDGAVD